ncbi:MAG TPA: GH92 family glycosyl hydrolase [Chitinophagaceae bacterium]|nr:GH92 family glycosyl hydrolase [Chitinophagaceae bacterium]
MIASNRNFHRLLQRFLSCVSCLSFGFCLGQTNVDLTKYVDPFIGTGGHGHVFIGANVPFGAVQLGPVNLSEGWDWCSGYNYYDSTIIGFAHTHLSGTGVGDLGDICVMPVVGDVKMSKGIAAKPETGYYSIFSHKEEKAVPGYYSVYLRRYHVKAELTATERAGLHQYTFPASKESKIIIDLQTGIGWDSPVKTFIEKVNDTTITGYRFSTGWAADQRIFFYAIFSKPFRHFSIYEDTVLQQSDSLTGKHTKAVALFTTSANERILVKVGISPVSEANALANINAELRDWNFKKAVQQATAKWNTELNKIKVSSRDRSRMRIFYTALFHTMVAPSIFNDHNGDYLGTDKKIYRKANFTNLTTFSLWDTYRAAHPLYTIFQTERVNNMINSMLAIYEQQGKLPVWHLMGNETNTMPGYSAVQVVVDAYLKGFRGFDTTLAWDAVRTTAMQDERAIYYVKKYGFIPADSVAESVATAMEYAIADGAIAQMARKLNKQNDYVYFMKRSRYYQNYFDPATRFMRGKTSQGSWTEPFNAFSSNPGKDDYTEGNAWQYLWLVPQDVEGLIRLLGGEKTFTAKLDSLFIVKGDLGKDAPPDISGLIGQYAHGNEPSHHIAYLYNYVGQPWKCADKIKYILDSLYSDKPDGISGNEDVGQMSAWYVLSALGFFQVNPAGGIYVIASPDVDEATIKVNNGKMFHLRVMKTSARDRYIESITLNGKKYSRSYLLYKDIMAGGEMTIVMGSQPSTTWGVRAAERPPSVVGGQ